MQRIGLHCSHELYRPSELLRLATLAEQVGFNAASCSDHFAPWSEAGQSGYAWSWLGAALERTSMDFGTVCAPGQRYHPAIIAQKAATLAEMYPGRFWLALGTGQNLNEHITGEKWPAKKERQRRLLQCVDIVRRLWDGETVTSTEPNRVHKAKLYTRPETMPLIFGAAITDETAAWVGSWADGLLTVGKPPAELANTVAAFRDAGGEGKPMRIQTAVSFGETFQQAVAAADRRWGHAGIDVAEQQDLETPTDFDQRAAVHPKMETAQALRVSADINEHIQWIRDDFQLGFDTVYLHYVGDRIGDFTQRIGECF